MEVIDIPAAPEEGAIPAPTPLPRDEIMRIAQDIVRSPLPAGSPRRLVRYGALYPEFRDAYPKLFEMCCGASDDNPSGRALMGMLPFLLERLGDLDDKRANLDDANAAVVTRLNSVYVEPVLGPPPAGGKQ